VGVSVHENVLRCKDSCCFDCKYQCPYHIKIGHVYETVSCQNSAITNLVEQPYRAEFLTAFILFNQARHLNSLNCVLKVKWGFICNKAHNRLGFCRPETPVRHPDQSGRRRGRTASTEIVHLSGLDRSQSRAERTRATAEVEIRWTRLFTPGFFVFRIINAAFFVLSLKATILSALTVYLTMALCWDYLLWALFPVLKKWTLCCLYIWLTKWRDPIKFFCYAIS